MISQMAIEDIEEMVADGLKPTPADIIRLNALGLKLEAAKKKHSVTSLDYLPRIAAITKDLYFRQPAIGHDIWMTEVERLIDAQDYQTLLAVKAYALSRNPADLPPIDAAVNAIREWLPAVANFTREQIMAALDYVIFGASPTLGEHPPSKPNEDDDAFDGEDWNACIALGVLHEGEVALWGMSRTDLERMTRQQLEEQIRRAYIFHGFSIDDDAKAETANYFATKDEILERLKNGK